MTQYTVIYIFHLHQITLTEWISLSLSHSICLYCSSLPAGLPNYILCLHRADVNKLLLVNQHWHVHVLGPMKEHHLWVHPFFYSSVPHVFVLLVWFLRWEVSGCTAAVLLLVFVQKQHVEFLYSFHLAFSTCILLTSMWCIHRVVLTQPQSCVISSARLDFHLIDNLFIAVQTFAWHMLTSLLVDEILLLRYVNLSTNFRGLSLKVEMTLSCLKHINSVVFVFI